MIFVQKTPNDPFRCIEMIPSGIYDMLCRHMNREKGRESMREMESNMKEMKI